MVQLKRNLLLRREAIKRIDDLTRRGEDYFFITDFEGEYFLVYQVEEASLYGVYFDFGGITNYNNLLKRKCVPQFIDILPISYQLYNKAFYDVQKEINYGNTYLLNLTFPSQVFLNDNCGLEDVFIVSKSPFKVWIDDEFVCFSPEPFIFIDNNNDIFTYPMKGTIDATLKNARDRLLNDKKEIAEHYTIVDLLRNDMAMIANDVRVSRFRFSEKIHTYKGAIWQTSSEITGVLKKKYFGKYGTLLSMMLPAGSISGAPKKKTVEIIKQVEKFSREFYTGIAGLYYNGKLTTAVMIRFIRKKGNDYFYYSGGGITTNSICENEYEEMIKKIYIPV